MGGGGGGGGVFRAFVNRILLEEGAPRIIRCDNGTEFKSRMLNGLCRELYVQTQFSPAYWPQGNRSKRLNRYLGETLRCITNTKNGRKQDWHQYAKFIEFGIPVVANWRHAADAVRGGARKAPASGVWQPHVGLRVAGEPLH